MRALIRATYGMTYSYPRLYEPGQLEGLWEGGDLLSLGEWHDGALIGHTGFWAKDPRGHSLESALSLVHPNHRKGPRVDYAAVWAILLEALGAHVAFVHQATTTLHPMAQLYAMRHMRARPAGLVARYTAGERVLGLDESGVPMHALWMTTVLWPPERVVKVPPDAFGAWLGALAEGLGLPVEADRGPAPPRAASWSLLEHNEALGLRRRAWWGMPTEAPGVEARVELLHVPSVDGVGAVAAALEEHGFLPVGLRPGHGEDHALIFQHVADRRAASASLGAARLGTARLRALWDEWRALCARTS